MLLEERFERLDEARWIVLGTPQVINGHLETRAQGGWEHYSGIATRQEFELHKTHPLVIEFSLTPLEMGIDSQVVGSANEQGTASYRFSFYGPGTRFGVYTQSSTPAQRSPGRISSRVGSRERTARRWRPRQRIV